MTDPRSLKASTLWLGIVLVLSLAANTFFIGLMVGGKLTAERWAGAGPGLEAGMDPGRMPPDLDPRTFARMLPDSARDDARALIEARGPDIRELFINAMAARSAALEAMRAEPFDADALHQALDATLEADTSARAAVHQLTVDIVAGMTPEERAQIGADLGRRFPDRFDRHEFRDHWRDRDRDEERRFERRSPPPSEGDDD